MWGNVAYMGTMRNARQHEKSRHKSEDNIKVDLRDIGLEGLDWIHLALLG